MKSINSGASAVALRSQAEQALAAAYASLRALETAPGEAGCHDDAILTLLPAITFMGLEVTDPLVQAEMERRGVPMDL